MTKHTDISLMITIVICVVLLTIVPIYFTYFLEQRSLAILQASSTANPTVTGKKAAHIIERVARAEKIPKDEIPTVVVVTDISTLSPFGQIRLGDYILLYHRASLAAVFDEITDRIINAVPVNIKNPNAK